MGIGGLGAEEGIGDRERRTCDQNADSHGEPVACIEHLPPELLVNIFRYLDNLDDVHSVMSVCHLWFDLRYAYMFHALVKTVRPDELFADKHAGFLAAMLRTSYYPSRRRLVPAGLLTGIRYHATRWAIARNHVDIFEAMLERYADLKLCSVNGSEALQWACACCIPGDSRVVEMILAQPDVDPGSNDDEPLRWACRGGAFEVVKLLLKTGDVSPFACDCECFTAASHNGHLSVVKLLAETFPQLQFDISDCAALRGAARNGHIEVVRFLLTLPGVDPTARNNYAIRKAHANKHKQVVELLQQLPGVVLDLTPATDLSGQSSASKKAKRKKKGKNNRHRSASGSSP